MALEVDFCLAFTHAHIHIRIHLRAHTIYWHKHACADTQKRKEKYTNKRNVAFKRTIRICSQREQGFGIIGCYKFLVKLKLICGTQGTLRSPRLAR